MIRVVPFDPVCFQNGSYCAHGRLSGTAVFYKILDDGSGPKVAGKDTSALINAKFEGKTFSFEVKGQVVSSLISGWSSRGRTKGD